MLYLHKFSYDMNHDRLFLKKITNPSGRNGYMLSRYERLGVRDTGAT